MEILPCRPREKSTLQLCLLWSSRMSAITPCRFVERVDDKMTDGGLISSCSPSRIGLDEYTSGKLASLLGSEGLLSRSDLD